MSNLNLDVQIGDPPIKEDNYLELHNLFSDKHTPKTWSDFYFERLTPRWTKCFSYTLIYPLIYAHQINSYTPIFHREPVVEDISNLTFIIEPKPSNTWTDLTSLGLNLGLSIQKWDKATSKWVNAIRSDSVAPISGILNG
jgi:hypothetical protein